MVNRDLMNYFLNAWRAAIINGNPVVTVFDSTPQLMYAYARVGESYSSKSEWADSYYAYPNRYDVEEIYNTIVTASNKVTDVKCCRLSKKSNGFRVRIDNDPYDFSTNQNILANLELAITKIMDEPGAMTKVAAKVNHVTKKKGTKMNDFSLSNLKDAIVDKVTHLDRKTVMILAIIALVLLIVGKYQTIKDIVLGIRDKVKNSSNFKAMVEDGTNAINSLKKIVGVKDKGAENKNEA